MKKTRTSKQALLLSVLSLLMCLSMLVGSTMAWFTDSVTSTGNKIQAGTLKLDLEMYNTENGKYESIKESKAPIFNYEKWEPGFTDVKLLKIENEGSLALKWMAKFVSSEEITKLADVIDVYVCPSEQALTMPADRDLTGYTKVGTVRDFVNSIETTTKGVLEGNSSAYLGIALKMQETAGNDYQGIKIDAFDILIVATQATVEEDIFNDQYDVNAPIDYMPVANANELKLALETKQENIVLTENIAVPEAINIDYDANIDGAGYALYRPANNTGDLITVAPGATLNTKNIIIDGGAVWTASIDDEETAPVNSGIVATGSLIVAQANAEIVLGEGTIVQNNDGTLAINLGTRIGATLTLNGAWIINNSSNAGAIWGGGHITINEGSKINNNRSTGIAGAIRMVSNCNLTMNGGEICGNIATTDGGAIWGYGASKFYLNGGKISGNVAGGVAGGIYPGTYSGIYISGDFEMCNNVAADSGAMRVTDHTTFNMTGGKIADNVSINNEKYNGFYGWNPNVTITGGELADNIFIQGGLDPTVGGEGITGVIYFDLGTNHNTVKLAENFGTIKFVEIVDTNFANFHFTPASTYVYTEGDEDKLVCLNEGYSTYWDAATGTFRLIAD